jgi:hypothetical protein
VEVEEDTGQDRGVVVVVTTNGEVDGAMKQDHLGHGVILRGTEVVGVEAGEMAHMVVVEKHKDFEVEEEEEEEIIRININVLTPYILQYLYHIDNFLFTTYTNIV